MLDVGPQVIQPSQPATLSASLKSCEVHQKVKTYHSLEYETLFLLFNCYNKWKRGIESWFIL